MIEIRKAKTLPAGKLKRIHVNGQVIRQNKRDGKNAPVYTVKCAGKNYYCRSVEGNVRAVQNFDKRLASGAVAWLESRDTLVLHP